MGVAESQPRYVQASRHILMLKLISAPNLASDQTIWIGGTNTSDNSIPARINRRRIVNMLKNARRFGKHVDLRSDVVSEPPRHPSEGTILGNLERTICMIPRNMGDIATKADKALAHGFRNRCSPRKLIVGNGIDSWARSERIKSDRGGR